MYQSINQSIYPCIIPMKVISTEDMVDTVSELGTRLSHSGGGSHGGGSHGGGSLGGGSLGGSGKGGGSLGGSGKGGNGGDHDGGNEDGSPGNWSGKSPHSR